MSAHPNLRPHFDATETLLRADLTACEWDEIEPMRDRWRSPDRKRVLPLAEAWACARRDHAEHEKASDVADVGEITSALPELETLAHNLVLLARRLRACGSDPTAAVGFIARASRVVRDAVATLHALNADAKAIVAEQAGNPAQSGDA